MPKTGLELFNYIARHQLEGAELEAEEDTIRFVIDIPADTVSDNRQLVYDFTHNCVYERYICIQLVTYEEAAMMRMIDIKEANNE